MGRRPRGASRPVPLGWRHRVLLVTSGLVALGLFLIVLEVSLALLHVGEQGLYDDPFVGFAPGSRLFTTATTPDGQTVYTTRPQKLAFFNEQTFAVEKPPETLRIFTLGGSTTAGRPYDDAVSFSRWLARYLDAAEPSRRHEVINAGAISYASYRITVLLKELVDYSPDVFVIYTGHNEFLEERTYSDIIHAPSALLRLQMWLSGYRSAALVRRLFHRDGGSGLRRDEAGGPDSRAGDDGAGQLSGEVHTRLDVWRGLEAYRRDEGLRQAIERHFAFNLQRMVQIARRHDVEVVFVEPVSNLKDFSPFKSDHAPGLSTGAQERFHVLLEQGRGRLQAGEPAAALRAFDQALEDDPSYAELHFRRGRALLAMGQIEAARRAFVEARDQDVAPLRATENLLQSIRQTARDNDLALIPLPTLLEALSQERLGHPIVGSEFLLDHVHPDMETHSLLATELLSVFVAEGLTRPDSSWSVSRREEIFRATVAGLDAKYYAQRDLNLAKVLGWAGKLEEAQEPLLRAAEVLENNFEVHLHLGTLWQRMGRYSEAARELERAVVLDGDSPEAFFNLGVTYAHLSRLLEAIEALERAVVLRPRYPEAHFNLGLLHRRGGNEELAVAALREALRLRPGTPEIVEALASDAPAGNRLAPSPAGSRLAGNRLAPSTAGDVSPGNRLAPVEAAGDAAGNRLAPVEAAGDAAGNRLAPVEEAPVEEGNRLALVGPGDDTAVSRVDRGIALARQNRLDEAARELERAIALDLTYVEAHYNLGVLRAQEGRIDEAVASYRRTLELDPDHAVAHNNLGILLANRGDLDRARQHLARAVEADPEYADAYLNLGVVCDNLGEPEQALRWTQEALRLRPDDANIHLALGLLYFAQGRLEEARVHLTAARRGGAEIPPEVAARL